MHKTIAPDRGLIQWICVTIIVAMLFVTLPRDTVPIHGQTEESCSMFGGEIGQLAFSLDGKYLLLGRNNIAELWDVTSRTFVRSFTGHGQQIGPGSLAVAFSPDGSSVVTGGGDATLRIWNTSTGQPQFRVDLRKGDGVNQLAYLANNKGIIASLLFGSAPDRLSDLKGEQEAAQRIR